MNYSAIILRISLQIESNVQLVFIVCACEHFSAKCDCDTFG